MAKHVIVEISYRANELECICGFKCQALDPTEFQLHRREAPPTDKEFKKSPSYYNTSILRASVHG